jgi:nucleoid DNA-binding protein
MSIGTGFKQQMAWELTQKGFTFREALAAVDAVFESIKEALQRHEDVHLPFGTLRVMGNDGPRREWRFGKVIVTNRSPYTVVFEPTAEGLDG